MNIWKCENWKNNTSFKDRRQGLILRFDNGVNTDLRNEIKQFGKWLRKNYDFPIRVPVYVKNAIRLRAIDGDSVVGTFFAPSSYLDDPYIRIAVGDYELLKRECSYEITIIRLIIPLAHELTHYFQWINGTSDNLKKNERQAQYYANKIISDYGYELI